MQIDKVIEIIAHFTEKECDVLEVTLKNGDSFDMGQVNKDESNQVLHEDDILIWKKIYEDGCVYERYIDASEISFVTGIYNCPIVNAIFEEEGEDTDV